MKDIKFVVLFVAIGLGIAWVASGPLRRPSESMPRVGTPLQNMEDMTKLPAQSANNTAGRHDHAHTYAEGTINVVAGVGTSRTLFITARALADGKPMAGPPLAAKKIEGASFPFPFSLTDADNMAGSEFYHGDIVLTVRLDADGMAGPKQEGDTEVVTELKADQSREVSLTLKD